MLESFFFGPLPRLEADVCNGQKRGQDDDAEEYIAGDDDYGLPHDATTQKRLAATSVVMSCHRSRGERSATLSSR